ncbi:MAG: hypothetical protein ACRDBY_14000 [Cetobacterium sp.]
MNFNNAMDVLNYFAKEMEVFKPVLEEFTKLQEENKRLQTRVTDTESLLNSFIEGGLS